MLVRLAFGLRRPRVAVQGRDVAGEVVSVGAGVTSVAVGDLVVGELAGGGLAPFVLTKANKVVPIPAGLDPAIAATLPLAGGTAWQALDLAGVTAGSRVLVVGAGGGVGMFAVALAVHRGAVVTALAGERALDVVRAAGAAEVLDYRKHPVLGPDSFDAIIDIAGSTPLRELQGLLRPGGIVALVSGGTNRVTGPLGRMLRASIRSIGSQRKLKSLAAVAKPDITRQLLELAAAGQIRPHIERTWQLSEAGSALTHIDSGHTVGKIVVVAE